VAGAALGCSSTSRAGRAAPAVTEPACQPRPVADRAGEVVIAGLPGVTDAADPTIGEVLDHHVGGVFITGSNVRSSVQAGDLVEAIRTRAGRPLVVATDDESGRVSTFAGLVGDSPSPRRLAAQRSPGQVRETARALGRELSAVGVGVDLAPVADVDGGPSSGLIGDRSFSADAATASRYATAFAQGLADAGVVATAKHFPGQGRARGDTHLRLTTIDATLAQLQGSDLVPFGDLIRAGIPVVMLSHAAYSALDPDLPASLSPAAYRLLRHMGFQGVAMTDSVAMGAVNLRWDYEVAAVKAIAAGADAILVTDGHQARRLQAALIAAVAMKELSEDRLDEAASRVVALAGGDPASVTCRRVTLPRLETAAVP
jgi:beta-N-acetylhexosaminidase